MSTAVCCMPTAIPTHRGLVQRAIDSLRGLWSSARSRLGSRPSPAAFSDSLADHLFADGLNAQTLRDVGFSAWQVERAQVLRSREIERWLW